MITNLDVAYAQEQQEMNQIRFNNLRTLPGQGREFTWQISQFGGFTSVQPQQTVNNQLYCSAAINVTPELFVASKAPGAEAVGFFRDIDPMNGYRNLICGELTIRRNDSYYLFCIIQDQATKSSSFYTIKDDPTGNSAIDGIWQRRNPIKYTKAQIPVTAGQAVYILPTGTYTNILKNGQLLNQGPDYFISGNTLTLTAPTLGTDKLEVVFKTVNGNFTDEYLFKGTFFDYVVYKSFLLICSGKEEYTDSQGFTSGLMMLDLEQQEWYAVPCGKAAPIDFSKTADRLEGDVPNNYNGNDTSLVINSLNNFNPSIIEEYKDRILISGDKSNPYQVKVSEHMNPRNFVSGILGYTVIPNTEEDRRRASTFFCKEIVRSMNTFGDSVLVGTTGRFYNYSLVDLGTTDVDRIQPDFSSNSGPINNKVCKVFREGQFFFASNYQIIPELNVRVLEQKVSAFGNAYSVPTPPEKLTFLIDEACRRFDASNSAVGVYKNSIFWSIAYCTNQNGTENLDPVSGLPLDPVVNNLTVVYSKIGDTPTYALWDHIKANYFAEIGNRGLIYSSSENGNVYKINENIYYVDNHIRETENFDEPYVPNRQDYLSVYQTGLVGVDSRRDSVFSRKRMKKLFFVGGFTGETVVSVDVFAVGNNCGDSCCDGPIFSQNIILNDNCSPSDCNCNLVPNLTYFRNAKYTKKYIDVPSNTTYNELYITFKVVNSANFYLNSIGGTYELAENEGFDTDLKLCPKVDSKGKDIPIADMPTNLVNSDVGIIPNCQTCNY